MTVLKPLGESCSAGTTKLPAAPHTSMSMGPSSSLLLAKAVSRSVSI